MYKVKQKKIIEYSILLISGLMFLNGYRSSNFLGMVFSTYLIIIFNILYFKNSNFLSTLFLITFSIFLLNRPLIGLLTEESWAEVFSRTYLRTSIEIIYISLLSYTTALLFHKKNGIRCTIFRNPFSKFSLTKIKLTKNEFKKLYTILVGAYVITTIASLYSDLDVLFFMKGKSYEEYYLLYEKTYPTIINILSRMNIFLLCAILATNPSRKISNYFLLVNIGLQIPTLLIGQRGGFILSGLFLIVYYLLRNKQTAKNDEWIGKKELYILFLVIPIVILGMTFINDIRHGYSVSEINIFRSFKDFFYKQGITFQTHYYGVRFRDDISHLTGSKNYLFSELYGPIINSSLFSNILNLPKIPIGNSLNKAIHGYWYSHILSYVSHPGYLKGFGYGTSYITEAFHTYGYIGIIITNYFLGTVLHFLSEKYGNNYYSNFIILCVAQYIFYIPRQPFTSFFSFIFKPYFLLTITFIFVVTIYLKKNELKDNFKSKISLL